MNEGEVFFNDLFRIVQERVKSSTQNIEIYSPFINTSILSQLLSQRNNGVQISIITRWGILDFALNSASLDLFVYAQKEGFTLFINPNLHLKSVVIDYCEVVLGSANVTSRGLGIHSNSNYECLAYFTQAPNNYLLYLEGIKADSTLVTEKIFHEFRNILDQLTPIEIDSFSKEDLKLSNILGKKDFFLISELPMSSNIMTLYKFIQGDIQEMDIETLASARHDILKYCLLSNEYSGEDEFRQCLKIQFFSHPFIKALCCFIDKPRRFGEIKAWVQRHCTDVPVPSRRSLTGNVRVLYNWLIELGFERFISYRPNHSEIIAPR